uniref:Uncharacterized protein n=1 Tax=Knipowitschia caucasica TaxID=637954 RepID=A0AAV2M9G4_KNICA
MSNIIMDKNMDGRHVFNPPRPLAPPVRLWPLIGQCPLTYLRSAVLCNNNSSAAHRRNTHRTHTGAARTTRSSPTHARKPPRGQQPHPAAPPGCSRGSPEASPGARLQTAASSSISCYSVAPPPHFLIRCCLPAAHDQRSHCPALGSDSGLDTSKTETQGSQSEEVQGSQSEEVQGSQSEEVQGSQSEGVQGSQSEGVQGSQSEEVQGSQSEGVQGSQSEGVQGSPSEGVQGSQPEEAEEDWILLNYQSESYKPLG